MTNTSSINLSNKIDGATLNIIRTVASIFENLNLPWLIVGATARDLLLHHGYGAPIKRATQDLDFAIEVANWDAFNQTKQKLIQHGFKAGLTEHRLIGPQDETVDVVPFGPLESQDSIIEWPPKGEVAMNVLGFSEACAHAETVLLCEETGLLAPVATPEGMILLKLIAWTDRAPDIRKKDAVDIKYLLESYEKIPRVQDEAYDVANASVMESYGWDLTLATAHLLGQYASRIANENTKKLITALLAGQIQQKTLEALAAEMQPGYSVDETNTQLIQAFSRGFREL